jgi:16S rRNA (cytosine1402-N4)-methyltransferase
MVADPPAHAEHCPVLLGEALDGLAIRPDGAYVDGTFGRGGHSRALLARLGASGRLLAFDRDPEAVMAAADLAADPRFEIHHAAFSSLRDVVRARIADGVDGVLLDLGVSSPQLDRAERGFSFRNDGPLDMRMDPTRGESAADFLAHATQEQLMHVLRDFGEERHALRIARAILAVRELSPLRTTRALQAVVAAAQPRREPGTDPATRTFQALRIHVNRELDELDQVLPQALSVLRQGARLVVISFHSLEDRRVKQFIARHGRPPEIPPGLAVREADRPLPPLRAIGRATFPGSAELAANPRARSAVLRVAERTGAALQ